MTWVEGMPPWVVLATLVVLVFTSAGTASILTARATARQKISEARKAEEDADKADAEARKVISDTTLQLLEPLKNRAQELEEKLRATESELEQAKRAARDLTLSLQHAQAETQSLRTQVDSMSKDLAEQSQEIERLRGLQHWQGNGSDT